jgi:alkanesulfonate monooxygenase SsuD/methylene tetrahydromethanopterin reductase-like flavin-dependent oxidoreductase (luciferase family)
MRPTPNRERISLYGAIGGSPESAEIMGRMGLVPMCTSVGDWDKQAATLTEWRKAATAAGHDHPGVRIPILVDCIVADTDDEAVAEACEYKPRYFQASLDHYAPYATDWEATGYTAHRQIFAAMEKLTTREGVVKWTDWQLIGSPATVAAKLKRFVEIGFGSFILLFGSPGTPLEVRSRWAETFAREVGSRFSAAFTAAQHARH